MIPLNCSPPSFLVLSMRKWVQLVIYIILSTVIRQFLVFFYSVNAIKPSFPDYFFV